MQSSVQFILAFVVVLALIGLTAWLVRRFGGNRLGGNANRGRMPRLAVIDAAAVDGRRRLVLVRRDNVEHLLMIGGPSDIVVEPNIIRAAPARDSAPARAGIGSELRAPSIPDAPSWAEPEPLEPEPVIAEPPPRPARPSFIEDPRRAAPTLPERRPEAVSPPEPPARPEPRPEPVLPRLPRSETPRTAEARTDAVAPRPLRADPPIRTMPPLRGADRPAATERTKPERASLATPTLPVPPPAAPVAPPAAPAAAAPAVAPPAAPTASADQNLADMAQRLEAALRRPIEPRGEAPEPRIGAPPVAPDAPGRSRAPDVSIATPARAEAPAVAPPVKSGFENLEDEMASLLGRPKSSS